MNEHKAVPNIRFKGFDDEWEDEKLGKITKYVKGYAFESRLYTENGIRIIKVTDLTKKKIREENKSSTYIFQTTATKFKKYIIHQKDIIITTVGSKTKLKSSSVGRAIYVDKSRNYLLNQNLVKITALSDFDSFFIYSQLEQPKYINYISKIERGNANQANIEIKDLWNYLIKVSSIKEQQKIGNLFFKLDKLLDLQQQKIDKLELLKKALLQKLFPKHDAKIPELRFKGFEDEWKKEKLSKLGHTFSGLSGKTKKDFGHGKAKYITYMNVFKNPLTSKTGLDNIEVDSKQHNVKYGDVLFTMSSETPEEVGMSSVWKYHLENIYLNSFSFGYRLSTKFDLNFLAFMFRSQLVRKEIKILAQGISRYNISKNKMMDIVAYFPTDSEQQKIGSLLSKVDQLIELENKKLQDFQQVKKCLLQNMFVE